METRLLYRGRVLSREWMPFTLETGEREVAFRLSLRGDWRWRAGPIRVRLQVEEYGPIGRIETRPEVGVELVRHGASAFEVEWTCTDARGVEEFVVIYGRPVVYGRTGESGRVSLSGRDGGRLSTRTFAIGPEQAEAERVRIEDEKRDVVAQYFFDAAEKFYRETKYAEARASLLECVKLRPRADLAAKGEALLRETEEILGIGGSRTTRCLEPEGCGGNRVSDAVQRVQILIEEGREALAAGEQETALRKFDSGLEILRWLPYHTPKRVLQAQLEDLRESAAREDPGG